MNFQQLRSIREAVRHDFNLTEAANALFTSQPGVSRQIRELEDELGVTIFVRAGKRLTGLTEPGHAIFRIIERLLLEAENMRQAGSEYSSQKSGTLRVATTHTQARYALPRVIGEFQKEFSKVRLNLQQSAPEHIAELVIEGDADIGIATEALDKYPELVTFPCYQWNHIVVVPTGHALLDETPLSLQSLGQYPLITYDSGLTGRSHIDEGFLRANVRPDLAITAMDADVIKTYVGVGLGVGLVAAMAFDAERDSNLRAIDASHLFQANTTRLAVRKGTYLRSFTYRFIELFAPQLSRTMIEKILEHGDALSYEL